MGVKNNVEIVIRQKICPAAKNTLLFQKKIRGVGEISVPLYLGRYILEKENPENRMAGEGDQAIKLTINR